MKKFRIDVWDGLFIGNTEFYLQVSFLPSLPSVDLNQIHSLQWHLFGLSGRDISSSNVPIYFYEILQPLLYAKNKVNNISRKHYSYTICMTSDEWLLFYVNLFVFYWFFVDVFFLVSKSHKNIINRRAINLINIALMRNDSVLCFYNAIIEINFATHTIKVLQWIVFVEFKKYLLVIVFVDETHVHWALFMLLNFRIFSINLFKL